MPRRDADCRSGEKRRRRRSRLGPARRGPRLAGRRRCGVDSCDADQAPRPEGSWASEGHMNGSAIAWIGLGSALVLVATLMLSAIVIVRLPKDYFMRRTARPRRLTTGSVLKNIAGVLLVVVGILLSLPAIPGPGFAVAFIGLTLVDFPGRARLQRRIVKRPFVRRALNRIRSRFGKPEFVARRVTADEPRRGPRPPCRAAEERRRRGRAVALPHGAADAPAEGLVTMSRPLAGADSSASPRSARRSPSSPRRCSWWRRCSSATIPSRTRRRPP